MRAIGLQQTSNNPHCNAHCARAGSLKVCSSRVNQAILLLQHSLGLSVVGTDDATPQTLDQVPVDPLLVSIDGEYSHRLNPGKTSSTSTVTQFGISTLDTRRLKSLSSSSSISELQGVISTYNLILTEDKGRPKRSLSPFHRATVQASKSELRQILNDFKM